MSDRRLLRRLPGRGRSLSGTGSAWFDGACLLLVDHRGYREIYRHLELADLTAARVVRTPRYGIVAVALTLCGGLVALPLLFVDGAIAGAVFAALSGGLALLLAVHLALGPTCALSLATATGWHLVHAVRRERTARRFLAALATEVEAVQGAGDLEAMVAAATSPTGATAGATPAARQVRASPAAAVPPRPASYLLHDLLAGVVGLDVVHSFATLQGTGKVLELLSPLLLLSLVGVAIAALLRQRGSDMAPPLARFPGWTLALVAGLVLVSMAWQFFHLVLAAGGPGPVDPAGLFAMHRPLIWVSLVLDFGLLSVYLVLRARTRGSGERGSA